MAGPLRFRPLPKCCLRHPERGARAGRDQDFALYARQSQTLHAIKHEG